MNWRNAVVAMAFVGLVLAGQAAMASNAPAGGAAVAPAEGAAVAPADEGTSIRLMAKAFAAALVASISIVGAAYAVARVGSAAVGAVAEKPELVGRTILFVALAEGLAVLGFAIAILIMYTM